MAGYTRQDTLNNIADGNIINASDFDNEYDAIEAAFSAVSGHTHDGTAAEGAPITKVGPNQDVVVSASAVLPKTDNTLDLGSSSFEFKDLYIDGTANIDSLVADTVDINAGTIDGVTIGGASAGSGTFTTVQLSSLTSGRVTYAGSSGLLQDSANFTFNGTDLTVSGLVNATTVDTTNLEVTNLKAKDGTSAGSIANSTGVVTLASSILTTTDINGGTVDGVTIGGVSPGAGTFTTVTTSADVSINGIEIGRGGGNFSSNTVVGDNAFSSNTSGVNCIAIGNGALGFNTTGTSNTAVGNSCLVSVDTGGSNTAVGSFSGGNITSGSSNTTIGWNTQTSAAGATSQVVIGASLTGKGNNTAFIGGTSGAYNAKNVTTWETTSDLRLKKDVTDNKEGLEHILAIRIRNFKYRTQDEITELPIESAVDKQGVQLGVIAQEIQQILPQLVTENSTGVLSLNTDPLLWYLINSVQSLKEELNQAKARIDALEST